jgi:hypothetical protein
MRRNISWGEIGRDIQQIKNLHPYLETIYKQDGFFFFFMCVIQHCFICRPSDSTVSEDAAFEPRTVSTSRMKQCNWLGISAPNVNIHQSFYALYLCLEPIAWQLISFKLLVYTISLSLKVRRLFYVSLSSLHEWSVNTLWPGGGTAWLTQNH